MSQDKEAEVIATATLLLGDGIVRGIIPASVLRMLKTKSSDKLAFELQNDRSVLVRKSTAAERKSGSLTNSQNKEAGVIALATISPHQNKLRGRIPAPVANLLKAKSGEMLAFERKSNGMIFVRKSRAAERKSGGSTSSRKASQKRA